MNDPDLTPDLKMDRFFGGRVRICQKKTGYRFSIDAAILAHHVRLAPQEIAVDLGTGCGIIPILLACRNPGATIYGIEIQNDLAALASKNVRLNRVEESITIVHGDLRALQEPFASGMADVVFSNPPYRPLFSGRLNPEAERAIARHEIKASLKDIVGAAQRLLKAGGCFVVIHRAERLVDLLSLMRTGGLEPKRLRIVYPRESAAAQLVVVEGRKQGSPGLEVSPPLIVHGANGGYTAEIEMMIGPDKDKSTGEGGAAKAVDSPHRIGPI